MLPYGLSGGDYSVSLLMIQYVSHLLLSIILRFLGWRLQGLSWVVFGWNRDLEPLLNRWENLGLSLSDELNIQQCSLGFAHLRVQPRECKEEDKEEASNLIHSILELEGLVKFFLHHQEARSLWKRWSFHLNVAKIYTKVASTWPVYVIYSILDTSSCDHAVNIHSF